MHLGFHCDQSSFSATIIDHRSGDTLHQASVDYDKDLHYRQTKNGYLIGDKPGECYVDPQMWVEAIDALMESFIEQGANLSAVTTISGVATPALIFLNKNWDKSLNDLNPNVQLNDQLRPCYSTRVIPISNDTSATDSVKAITSKFSKPDYLPSIIGSQLDSSKGAAQIHQLFSASIKTWEDTVTLHTTSSFIHSILIGKSAPLDLSDSSQLGLYDLQQNNWNDELLEASAPDLKGKLPTLTKSNKASGKIADYFTYKYGFSPKAECFPWIGVDAARAIGHGVFSPSCSLLSLDDKYDYYNYHSHFPKDIPDHACIQTHPISGYLIKFSLNNGLTSFKQTIKNLDLNLDKIENHLDALPSSNSLPTLPFLKRESNAIPKAEQDNASLLSLSTGQILHIQLFSQWANQSATELKLTGEGSNIASFRILCANIFQLPTYHQPNKNKLLIGTMIPYLISEHKSLSSILKNLVNEDKNPETKHEPFMAGFYTNQLQEYFQLLTTHINQ